jgi:S-methyl-5-thioribose-1-phosphate isomerase
MLVNGKHYRTVWMEKERGSHVVRMVNQLLIPHKFEVVSFRTYKEVAEAIKTMVVRGAGAIGAAAAYGMALGIAQAKTENDIRKAAKVMSNTRPTARNLFYGIECVLSKISSLPFDEKTGAAFEEAQRVADEDVEHGRLIGEHGAKIIKDAMKICTHCNAGWLAFVDWGTALSPVYTAKRQGKDVFVWVDETGPRNQGSRLTAWELMNEGVPCKIIDDNAAGFLMQMGEIDMVIVGADRIAVNGDVANKIGTYEKAVLAKENGIPFYVAAPTTTMDMKCPSGKGIPIERRNQSEVLYKWGWSDGGKFIRIRTSPKNASALNLAFDVTPAKYVTGMITEKGIVKPTEISKLFG